jgi:mannose-6-phosphate isomerase-like protein (cupin superfamily)
MTFSPRAVVVRNGEGEVVNALGSRYRYKALGESTNGAYSLVEETLLDHEGPPLHVHDHEEEAFYVLGGRGVFVVGEERNELEPGDFVIVPRGAPHALARTGAEDLRMLVITSPAGLEEFFVEVQRREAAAGIPMDEGDVVALASAFGTRIVGPPIGPC